MAGDVLPAVGSAAVALLIFVVLGAVTGGLVAGAVIGAGTAALLLGVSLRTRVSVGPNWLAVRRVLGVVWVSLPELTSVAYKRNTGGGSFVLKDSRGHRAVVPESLVPAGSAIAVVLAHAVAGAARKGATIDATARRRLPD